MRAAEPMGLDRAIERLKWGAGGFVFHPTSTCAVYRSGDCTCGLWDAIRLVSKSRFARFLIDYDANGTLPK